MALIMHTQYLGQEWLPDDVYIQYTFQYEYVRSLEYVLEIKGTSMLI
jgi:hypothetical protein